jgi:hypothetical protein
VFFYLSGTSLNTICAPDGSADGGAGGGLFIGGGGGGAWGTLAFTFFGAGPPTFLLGSARTLPACAAGTCVVAALMCSIGCGGTKRARAAAAGLPTSLGFAPLGGGVMEDVAVAAAEGGME